MWTECLQRIDDKTLKLSLQYNGQPASFAQVINSWQYQADFAVFFNRLLMALPFEAFFWEMPALLASGLERPFECVFVDSPALARASADRQAFQQYFPLASEGVISFKNLGGDALLLVPVPLTAQTAYPHLAAFARSAPVSQQCALWQQLGKLCDERLGSQALWLNTSGLGVWWTHIRFDSYPKYYSYVPYKQIPGEFSV